MQPAYTFRANFSAVAKVLEGALNDCKLNGVFASTKLLEQIVGCYEGEVFNDYSNFESTFGDLLSSEADALSATMGYYTNDIWAIGDLPKLYEIIVTTIYPEIVKALSPFSSQFGVGRIKEVRASDPFYTFILMEQNDEQSDGQPTLLDSARLEALWRDQNTKYSI